MSRSTGTPAVTSALRPAFDPGTLVALAILLAVAGATYYRLYFGVNFSD